MRGLDKALLAVATVACSTSVQAQVYEPRSCLEAGLDISAPNILKASDGLVHLSVDVTNEFDQVISGIRFDGILRSPDREVPLHRFWFWEPQIGGGLSAGETMTIEAYIHLDDNAAQFLSGPTSVVAEYGVTNLVDADGHPQFDHPAHFDWDRSRFASFCQ